MPNSSFMGTFSKNYHNLISIFANNDSESQNPQRTNAFNMKRNRRANLLTQKKLIVLNGESSKEPAKKPKVAIPQKSSIPKEYKAQHIANLCDVRACVHYIYF